MTRVYYNEIDPYCVRWLHNLILEGVIAPLAAEFVKAYMDCRPT